MDSTSLNVLVMIATAATAIFTGWAVWQRWRYTPRPHWLDPVVSSTEDPYSDGDPGSVQFTFANRGDATAMDVRIAIATSDGWDERKTFSMVDPGDDAAFWMQVPGTYPGRWDVHTDKWEAPLTWSWTETKARISWRQHPRLKRVKSRTFILPRPTDRP